MSASAASAGLPDTFKRLYHFLVSNGAASRAERLVEELALVLLTKRASEDPAAAPALARFRAGEGTSAELWDVVCAAFPALVDPGRPYGLADATLRRVLELLDGVSLSDAPAHVLGEAFQALVGPRIRGDRGQFFTPRAVVDAMVAIVAPRAGERVVDPACGTGGFVAAAARAMGGRGQVVGVDKDGDLARLAGAALAVIGGDAAVHSFDSLDPRAWVERFGSSEGLFDVALANPPFGAKIPVLDPEVLASYDLGRRWVREGSAWRRTDEVRAAQDPQLLFVERCVRLVKPGGRLGIVLPEGLFGNRGDGWLWDWLRQRGRVTALLDCPRTTFQPGTDIKTNVLFFEVGPTEPRPVDVAVALHCGHDRRGRATRADGAPYADDFPALAEDYHAEAPRLWRRVPSLRPHYLVPRYYLRDAPYGPSEAAWVAGAEEATLGELVAAGVLEIRRGHEPGSEAYGTGDVPFVRTSDLANFEISTDPTKSVGEAVYERFAPQQRLAPGDVLLVVDGRYRIGAVAMLTERNARCVVQSHLRVLSLRDPAGLTPYALMLALTLPTVRLRLRSLVFVQSTLGTLGARLLELRLPLLRGEGPWTERVATFERTLRERDRLLGALRSLDAGDVEL